jgi:hypothetical protein
MNKKLVYLVVVILLVGGGYWYFSQNKPAAPEGNNPAASQTVPAAEQQKPASNVQPQAATSVTPEAEVSTALPVIDETWRTYASKQNDFSFKWPTRGRYAPTWDVQFADQDCDAAADGRTKTTLAVGGFSFCHMSWKDAAAGTTYLNDVYTTKVGSHFVVISFLKKAYSAGALNCSFANEYPFSTSAQTCIKFEEPAYYAHLDQIVGTFKNAGN